jgi:glyoxylase-like metal-dependent hydrolase (beta-lactamase superfamily II)
MTSSSPWFTTHSLAPHLWAIDDNKIDIMYVITGAERAMLLDTGMGIGDLAAEAQAITSLPLIVANTHGHIDHITGNGQFPQVHIAAEDMDAATEPWTDSDRANILKHFFSGDHAVTPPPGFAPELWGSRVAGSLVPVKDGQIFDLGGRQLEAFAIPGHTPGCMGFLDRQARLLFVGDAILGGVWMQLDESLPLHQYRQSLLRVLACRDAFDWMYSGHNLKPFPAADLEGFVDGIGRILSGELAGKPEQTFAGDGLRWNYNSLGVLYLPDRL